MIFRSNRKPAVLFLGLLLVSTGAHGFVTRSEVERESERVFRQMKQRIPISRNAEATAYVECVARSIIARLDEPHRGMEWEIVLFEHGSANAFAMPGGRIGVFTGIFRAASDQDSLAAVIGHEIAHVVAEHSLKRARRQIRNNLLVIAAAGALGGGGDALSLGAQVGLDLPHDRKHEVQADAEGLRYMSQAGFDPRASLALWKNMSALARSEPPAFLSTHPSTDGRLDRLISQLAESLVLYNEAAGRGLQPRCE